MYSCTFNFEPKYRFSTIRSPNSSAILQKVQLIIISRQLQNQISCCVGDAATVQETYPTPPWGPYLPLSKISSKCSLYLHFFSKPAYIFQNKIIFPEKFYQNFSKI